MKSIEIQVDDAQRANDRLKFADSYTRMEALLNLRYFVPAAHFWRELGLNWSICDNIHRYKSDLLLLFDKRRRAGGFPITEAMDDTDRQHYEALPERVPLFRGCYARNKSGLSWSTSREVAASFPFYMRYRGPGKPLLLTATVRKANIVFLTGGRTEEEIIVIPRDRRILTCEEITTNPLDGATLEF